MLSQMDPQELAERGVNFDPAVMQPEQWVLSSGYGKTAAIRVNPLEIQEDFQVEAEAGSYLAVDDDLRRAAANDLEQVALSAPDVIDIRKVVRFHLGTIRGIGDPDSYIKPEQPKSSVSAGEDQHLAVHAVRQAAGGRAEPDSADAGAATERGTQARGHDQCGR